MSTFAPAAISVLAGTGTSSCAAAQSTADVVGTWLFVSSVRDKDGGKVDTYGAGAKGAMVLDSGGRYSITIIGANLPKFAAGNIFCGNADENAAVLGRSNAHFGTYSVDTAEKTITFRTERGTFPNDDGRAQTRNFIVDTDKLTYVIPLATGGTSVVTWQRAK